MSRRKINVAIDGHSSCGKSTLAKELAAANGYLYIDSGAMYRAVALYLLTHEIAITAQDVTPAILDQIDIKMTSIENKFQIYLNGKEITQRIIRIDVSSIVSEVAALSAVRKKLVEIQQNLGIQNAVVMDGRDIGTVVYPEAELKLFVTADIEVRSQRRYLELQQKGMETAYDEVRQNLLHRDHIDSSRSDSPLRKADDAILIDNSYMDRKEQLFLVQKLFDELTS